MGKGSKRRREDKKKIDDNWPFPDKFQQRMQEKLKDENMRILRELKCENPVI